MTCWHETEATVTVEMLIANLVANASVTKEAIANLAPTVPVAAHLRVRQRPLHRHHHPARPDPGQVKKDLAPLLGKYVH